MPAERLQKILSAAGVSSRRAAEDLIREGRVQVNGETVLKLGTKADPSADRVTVDGRAVRTPGKRTYLLLYKPKGYVSTAKDPERRPTVMDLLPRCLPRVFHVGRLDYTTEGLLLLTNDGDFAQRVAHPRHGCEKMYLAKVSGVPAENALERLRRGVPLDGVRTAPARVELVRSTRRDGNTWLALTLAEGRSRQVRRMLEAVGHRVSKLRRVRIGPLTDRGLAPGTFRELEAREVAALLAASVPRPRSTPGPHGTPRPQGGFAARPGSPKPALVRPPARPRAQAQAPARGGSGARPHPGRAARKAPPGARGAASR